MRIWQRVAKAINASANGIALAQALGGAAAVTLNGATVKADDGTASYDIGRAVLDPPRPVVIHSVGNDSGITFTIKGTDRLGNAISEVLAGANGGDATSVYNYKTVISITSSGATAGNITVGYTATCYTPWIILGNERGHYMWTLRVFIPAGATVNYDVQATSANVMRNHGDYADDIKTLLAGQVGNVDSSNDEIWAAVRLKVTAQDHDVTLRVLPSRTA